MAPFAAAPFAVAPFPAAQAPLGDRPAPVAPVLGLDAGAPAEPASGRPQGPDRDGPPR